MNNTARGFDAEELQTYRATVPEIENAKRWATAEELGRLVILPCAVADTVYFINKVDCYDCSHAEECPSANTGGRGQASPEPKDPKSCPHEIVECFVEDITYADDGFSTEITLNGIYTPPPESIFFQLEQAFKSLREWRETQ